MLPIGTRARRLGGGIHYPMSIDLSFLRAHPQQLATLLRHQRIRQTPVGGGFTCLTQRLTLDDGSSVFTKQAPPDAPPGLLAAEEHGLGWLRAAGAPVPEVIAHLPDLLVLEWIPPGEPGPAAAERLGRDLAALHADRVDAFGAAWPGRIGTLDLDNTPSQEPWPQWFARCRIEPYLRRSAAVLDPADITSIHQIMDQIDRYAGAGGSEPPARLHGDLWPGNLVWSTDHAWLVDPAAHAGHRESDLAQLDLFGGAPFGDRIRAAYQEIHPLAEGWQQRVPLHQLHLLLVHTAIFGASFASAVRTAVRTIVRTAG